VSQIIQFSANTIAPVVKKIIPDTGDNVTPTVAGEINLAGGNLVATTGVAATNTVTVDVVGGTDGQVIIADTGGVPAFADITSTGSTITITPGAHTLNLETAGSVATSYLTDDTNSAVPLAGVLQVVGGVNASTTSAGNSVIVNVDSTLLDMDNIYMVNGGALRTDTTIGDTLLLQAYDNDTGPGYTTFATLTAGNTPTMDLSDSVTKAGNYIYRAGGTDVPVADGGTGASTLAAHGILLGQGTSAITSQTLTDGQLLIGKTGAFDPVAASLSAGTGISITPGAGSITIANTLPLTGTTNHALQVGNAGGTLTSLAVGATGQTIMGTTGADCGWTGSPSFSGTVTAGTGLTVTSGNATITSGNITLPTTTSTIGQIVQNGNRILHSNGSVTRNFFAGNLAGNFTNTAVACTAVGAQSLKALTNGNSNTMLGEQAGLSINSGGSNCGFGQTSLATLTTGEQNLGIGHGAGNVLATGSYNTLVGHFLAGGAYTGSESSNICISNAGVIGESNKMRLGTDGTGNGQVDTVYLAGTNANISTAATAGTVNIATGAAAKTVTLGSTNTTSKLDLKFGTADFSIASATGTVMNILDTGEMTRPLQPAFLAYSNAVQSNVTGDGTYVTIAMNTEVYDQNADFDTGTYTFTAPVTGRYLFSASVHHQEIAAGMTGGYQLFVTSNRTYFSMTCNPVNLAAGSSLTLSSMIQADMDAGDTCYTQTFISGGTKTVDIYGAAGGQYTFFAGHLIC